MRDLLSLGVFADRLSNTFDELCIERLIFASMIQ
jgi:hypothetical protein